MGCSAPRAECPLQVQSVRPQDMAAASRCPACPHAAEEAGWTEVPNSRLEEKEGCSHRTPQGWVERERRGTGQAASGQHSSTELCRPQGHAQFPGGITPSFHLPTMGNNPTHTAVHMARPALSRLSPASLCLQNSSAHVFPVWASVTGVRPSPS